MKEEWRFVEGTDVEVSNLGNVRGYKTKKLRKKHIDSSGAVKTAVNDSSSTVHRLVAKAFLGLNEDTHFVRHKNHDKGDNQVDNLILVAKKAYKLGGSAYKITGGGKEPRYYSTIKEAALKEFGLKGRTDMKLLQKKVKENNMQIKKIKKEDCPELFTQHRDAEVRDKQVYTIQQFLSYVNEKYGEEWFIGWDIPKMCRQDEYVREYYQFVKMLA